MIEITDVWSDMKKHVGLYYILLPTAFVISLIYALSLPNFFTCQIMLSPEMDPNKKIEIFRLLYALETGRNVNQFESAFAAPTTFPDIVNSAEYKKRLLSVKVKPSFLDEKVTYYYYLLNYRKNPWWKELINKKEFVIPQPIDIKRLTYDEAILFDNLSGMIKCSVQKGTYIITIHVTDQDPNVCVQIAESAKDILQDMVQQYFSKKAERENEYYKKMASKKHKEYLDIQKQYADYVDTHRDVLMKQVKSQQTILEEELDLQFRVYSDYVSMQIASEAKIQEAKPILATLQRATAPLFHDKPDRARITVLFTMFVFFLITSYILYKEDFWRRNLSFKI